MALNQLKQMVADIMTFQTEPKAHARKKLFSVRPNKILRCYSRLRSVKLYLDYKQRRWHAGGDRRP